MSFLSENVFSSVDTRCYFEGLLPEGFTRKTLAEEGVRLAPCYDIISTRFYKNNLNEMSLSINGKLNINDISRKDFELEAKSIGLGSKIRLQIKSGINRGWTRMCGYKISSILSKKNRS